LERDFIEIYCNAPLSVCEQRDVKGMYKLARAGKIRDFTGISSPYEEPDHPELILDTAHSSIDECVDAVVHYLFEDGIACVEMRQTRNQLQGAY
jgi:adenylylsulfate kinase